MFAMESDKGRRLAPGASFGRYRLLERLGAGSMGEVWSALDPLLDRKVALKLVKAEGTALEARAERKARLLREAQVMARISHPNVLAVFDSGECEGEVYLALELVEGATLREWLAAARRPWPEVLAAYALAGRGLAAAHAAGLVHRDFKPDNALVDAQGRVRVTDFGLARPAGPAPAEAACARAGAATSSAPLTQTGALAGTPGYMAPEQLLGRATDARTDQFSFCVALFEALYGARPFEATSLQALAFAVCAGKVRRPAPGSPVPRWLHRALLKGLSPDPASRYESMGALLEVLDRAPERRRRRRAAAGLAIGLAIAAGAGLLELRQRRLELCAGGPRRFAQTWDAQRRRAVETALAATGRPFSAGAAREVGALLDAYAHAWSESHREACEATRVRGEQSERLLDLRMRCLERRRGEVAALVELLERADGSIAERALPAAQALRGPESCRDSQSLAAVADLPADANARAAVEDGYRAVAEAKALVDTARYSAAIAAAEQAAAKARALGYAPLLAGALYAEGDARGKAGDPAAAERLLLEAADAADRGGDDEERAHALAGLVWYVGVELGRRAEAHRLARQALGALERLGPGSAPLQRGRLAAHLAKVLSDEGRPREALAAYDEAEAMYRRALPPKHVYFASLLTNRGAVLEELKRLDEALDHYRRALAAFESMPVAEHPWVDTTLNNLGVVLADLGRLSEAAAAHQRALAIKEALLPPDHPDLSFSLQNLAELRASLGDGDRALALARRALALRERAGADPSLIASAMASLALAHRGRGELDEARKILRRALDLEAASLGAFHPGVARYLSWMGDVAFEQGRPAEALDLHRRALAIRERAHGPEHLDVAASLASVARAELEVGRPAQALESLERAWSLREPTALDPGRRGETAFWLARALWEAGGDRGRALRLAQRARELVAASEGAGRRELPAIDAWLARRAR